MSQYLTSTAGSASRSSQQLDERRGASLVSACGRTLPLEETQIEATAQGGIARVRLLQRFKNAGAEPLRVTYLLPLPENAAVSGFSFELDGLVTRGVVKARESARADFEEALLEGRSAALLEEASSTLFRQEIGNVPAGAEIIVTIEVDQKLTWRTANGAWEWRFPTVVAPRYQESRVPQQESKATHVPVADLPDGAHLSTRARLNLRILDDVHGKLESPSHRFHSNEAGVRFLGSDGEAGGGVPLDRDIVVRWPVASALPGVSLSLDGAHIDGAREVFGLLTIVPPTAPKRTVPRDLIVLLDTSGSMSGEPLDQAVRVVSALVDSLGKNDHLELLEFSSSVSRWKRGPRTATAGRRASAKRWLKSLRASGSTKMHGAILESLALLGPESQRQVLIVTDGLIGGERQLVAEIASKLPRACRVHSLGIGHGVNRTLTAGAARAGRGVEQVVAPGEDPAKATAELLASMKEPVVVDLEIGGSALGESACAAFDAYAATPSLVPIRLAVDAQGRPSGTLLLEGRTAEGAWKRTLEVADARAGSGANAALFARERVQELEAFDLKQRSAADLDAEIERLGVSFQIATRRTSWVAVSEARSVDPNEPTRTVEMPHELGAGLSAEGLGLREASPMPCAAPAPSRAPMGIALGKPKKVKERKRSRPLRDECGFAESMPPEAPEEIRSQKFEVEEDHDDDFAEGANVADFAEAFKDAERPDERTVELTAKLLLQKDGQLVLSFDAPADLVWSDVGPITVEFEDGTSQVVTLEAAGSTAGPVAAGAAIRLVLSGLDPKETLRPVRVTVRVHLQSPMALNLLLSPDVSN